MPTTDDFFAIDLDSNDPSKDTTSPGPAEQRNDQVLDLDETVLEGPRGAEAEYSLESPVRCPTCRTMISTLLAIRLVRSRVTFISTLPRRGYLTACPSCRAVLPADLSGLLI